MDIMRDTTLIIKIVTLLIFRGDKKANRTQHNKEHRSAQSSNEHSIEVQFLYPMPKHCLYQHPGIGVPSSESTVSVEYGVPTIAYMESDGSKRFKCTT